jgi:hypothetical protein
MAIAMMLEHVVPPSRIVRGGKMGAAALKAVPSVSNLASVAGLSFAFQVPPHLHYRIRIRAKGAESRSCARLR